jgi:tRNA-modifying protein YgfZ
MNMTQQADSDVENYNHIRTGGACFVELPRGLIAVWGKEAIPFLDGMITNDMKTLEDGQQMLAAFPNAQGRLLAVVRVLRQGDQFYFETEEATREKLFENLFRFTYAGDFFVQDYSTMNTYFEIFGQTALPDSPKSLMFSSPSTSGVFVPSAEAERFRSDMIGNDLIEIGDDLFETLRIESGVPKYGIDMDENTIVPELSLDGMISYTKGCYVGQEIIARIHFRGHVAKKFTGLLSEPGAAAIGVLPGSELTTPDGKNAGRITSVTYSPKLERTIALAFVRYDFLAPGNTLHAGEAVCTVGELPFL